MNKNPDYSEWKEDKPIRLNLDTKYVLYAGYMSTRPKGRFIRTDFGWEGSD